MEIPSNLCRDMKKVCKSFRKTTEILQRFFVFRLTDTETLGTFCCRAVIDRKEHFTIYCDSDRNLQKNQNPFFSPDIRIAYFSCCKAQWYFKFENVNNILKHNTRVTRSTKQLVGKVDSSRKVLPL